MDHVSAEDRRLFACGCLALAVGILVYVIARPAGTIPYLPHFGHFAPLPVPMSAAVGSLPTFSHAVAFSLLLAALLGTSRRRQLFACAAWTSIELLFEVAQHPVARGWLFNRADSLIRMSPAIERYLQGSTFDVEDLLAAVLGGILAAALVVASRRTT